jgi:hypothetical protein
MARSAIELLTNTSLHAHVAQVACQRVREQYCADRIVPQYEEYYRKVVEGN